MNIALVGAGMIGRTHIENVRADGRGEITWVCSRSAESVRAVQRTYEVENGTTELSEALSDNGVEAVILASPPAAHREQAEAVLAAGKHLLIEKPLAPSREEARAIAALAQSSRGQVVLSCSSRHARLQPKYRLVKQLLDSGEIGELYHIHHTTILSGKRYGIEYNPAAAWGRSRETAGGGPLIDWGVYDLSFHFGLMDDAPSVQSASHFAVRGLDDRGAELDDFDVEEHGALHMRLSNGVSYYYERASNAHYSAPNETRLFGSHGALVFDYHSWAAPEIRRYRRSERGTAPELATYTVDLSDHRSDHYAIIAHFMDCCERRSEPAVTADIEAKHLDTLFDAVEETRALAR